MNIKNIKNCFIILTLILFFHSYAFATDIKKIASLINEGFVIIEEMAYSEYKKNIQNSDRVIKEEVIKRLEQFNDYLDSNENKQIDNLDLFINAFNYSALILKTNLLSSWTVHEYENKDPQFGIQDPSIYIEKFAKQANIILFKIYDYLNDDKTFSEGQYKEFVAEISYNLSDNQKDVLFKSLKMNKIHKISN